MTMQIDGTNGWTFPDGSVQKTAPNNMGFKNRIINGAMMIDQRNAGSSVAGTAGYSLDRWYCFYNSTGTITLQQSSTAPTGFKNSLVATVGTADTSIAAGEYVELEQRIEGYNVADLDFGTANAKTVTLSFWVRSAVTGTYCVNLRNSANNRGYVAEYTISSANTWEQKTITIAGDTSGTWLTTNGIGLTAGFSLAVGSTFQQAAGSWGTTSYAFATSSQTNWMATSGNTFYITGVQLEKGSTATSFDYRPYGTELSLCQRYYQYHPSMFQCGQAYGLGTDGFTVNYSYPVTMRIAPTATIANGTDGGSAAQLIIAPVTNTKCTFQVRNNGGAGLSKWYTWDSFFNAELQ